MYRVYNLFLFLLLLLLSRKGFLSEKSKLALVPGAVSLSCPKREEGGGGEGEGKKGGQKRREKKRNTRLSANPVGTANALAAFTSAALSPREGGGEGVPANLASQRDSSTI